jgi:hypothetical protein
VRREQEKAVTLKTLDTRCTLSVNVIPPRREPMRRATLTSLALLSGLVLTGNVGVLAAYCTPLGKGTCTACKTCRYCHHCAENGGYCTVCK